MSIKEELDKRGFASIDYKNSGYNSYVFYFTKEGSKYMFEYELSKENDYEESLDYYESEDFNDIVKYIKEEYNYEIH